MTRSPHGLMWLAFGAGGVVFTLAVMALIQGEGVEDPVPRWLIGLVAVAGWLGILLVHEMARRHYENIKVLRLGLEAVARGHLPPEQLSTRFDISGSGPSDGGLPARMATLILDIATRRALETARPDQRLASVIASLKDGVVVVTETGQVSLVNSGAKALLGAKRVALGTSVFAALDRDTVVAAINAAHRAERKAVEVEIATVDGVTLDARIVDFGEHRGVVITFPADEVEHAHAVEIALDLHDVPPEAPAPVADTLLDDLPVTVLDTETTGLDVTGDRIVSVGAVRVHGGRLYRSTTIDRLVHPGRLIPQRSTAVHGITNAMVADQPPAAEVLPDLLAMVQGTVVIGHNIGFDLTMLKRAASAAGLDWPDPPWLDTILLASALDPDETDLNLDSLAERMGVNVSGRHTALGDSLVTAEIYVRMLPQLARQGVRTLGEAVAFSQQARRVIAQQRAAGW